MALSQISSPSASHSGTVRPAVPVPPGARALTAGAGARLPAGGRGHDEGDRSLFEAAGIFQHVWRQPCRNRRRPRGALRQYPVRSDRQPPNLSQSRV
jgi:hypothetical protein